MSNKTFKDIKVGDVVYYAKSYPHPSVEERTVCDIRDSVLKDKKCIMLNEIPYDLYFSIFDVNDYDEYYEGAHVRICLDKVSAVKYVDKDINHSIQFDLKLLSDYISEAQTFRSQHYDILY